MIVTSSAPPRAPPSPANMPKDYFEAPEVEEEFLTEEEKHVKVIEFVYQVDRILKQCVVKMNGVIFFSILNSYSWVFVSNHTCSCRNFRM